MKLSELKNGAVVECRNGKRFLKVDDVFLCLNDFGYYMHITEYKEDLNFNALIVYGKSLRTEYDYDIMKVNNEVYFNGGKAIGLPLRRVFRECKWTWVRGKGNSILLDKEKEYLKAVCKPYDVLYIRKHNNGKHKEFLNIALHNSGHISLPNFYKNTMYKNMESDRKYTLEELEINYD